MSNTDVTSAGQTLRRLRRQRGLTLEQVATAVGMSVAVLSRKERGEQALKRQDIRTLIEQLGLSLWEAYELWIAAGFLPEYVLLPECAATIAEAAAWLSRLPFPACVLSSAGYLLAWNQPFEALQHPSWLATRPLHLLDSLRRTAPPPAFEASRADYLAHGLRLLAGWMDQETQFACVLNEFSQRSHEDLLQQWNDLQAAETDKDPSASVALLPHSSPEGEISYVALRGIFVLPRGDEVLLLVPAVGGSEEGDSLREVPGGKPPGSSTLPGGWHEPGMSQG